jgi:hypothetical protein
MPSKAKQRTNSLINKARPFTVFFVDPLTPEEVHTDTIMARDCENALAIAAEQQTENTILHIRSIGDDGVSNGTIQTASLQPHQQKSFPCARFINGKFHQTTFSDDRLLESLLD